MGVKDHDVPEYFWRSLGFFCFYRLIVALLLFLAAYFYGDALNIGGLDLALFIKAGGLYAGVALGFIALIYHSTLRFQTQLLVQVLADVVFLTVLLYSSGGQKSGLAVLVLIAVAGAGLVGQGRMTLFFAATASVAMLLEQSVQILRQHADPADFIRTGLICIGFFGMAITARLLARRVVANEELARARGVELARQLAISNRIIAEMTDGVLVLDQRGIVRQSNQAADRLLEVHLGESRLSDWSPHLVRQFHLGKSAANDQFDMVRPGPGKLYRMRMLGGGDADSDPVVFVEDMERVQTQAQQMKLAALGRLTANIAHEIRNPLAAISHAAELLGEDEQDVQRRRLARIIGDNTARLNRLVTDVLELGRRERATREQLDWLTFLRGFLVEFSLHDPSAAERIVVAGDSRVLLFDRGHLHRVLWNLFANALRHASAEAGAVCVRLSTSAGRYAAIDIIDDGPGITGDLRQQIFEPFVTNHGAGTGLGLYIARELCDANGASLQLLDDVAADRGATFRISVEVQE
jgi:two-component system sensor histidine kinase PilS (NtrC family)